MITIQPTRYLLDLVGRIGSNIGYAPVWLVLRKKKEGIKIKIA